MNAETIGAITEAELQATILDMAQTFGWRCHHEYDSRIAPRGRGSRTMTDKGYPDLTLVRGDKLLYVEVKKESGKVSRDQELWLAALRACGVRAEVWRPSDLDNGTIEVILKEGGANGENRK
tara:strand:+ start:939 stop:1304 length:366 start_codon:yes stop_codon:yes gene_type:complete